VARETSEVTMATLRAGSVALNRPRPQGASPSQYDLGSPSTFELM
jgi:hypothetical protein